MSKKNAPMEDHSAPGVYEIRIQGTLDEQWSAWFEGLKVTREDDGQTRISGRVVDQAALHGLLKKVRDLGMPLISVLWLGPDRPDRPDETQES